MKLDWTRCLCGHPQCFLMHPKNFGAFYQGTGFIPAEARLLNEAFEALDEKNRRAAMAANSKAPPYIDRYTYPSGKTHYVEGPDAAITGADRYVLDPTIKP
jgi:hypothetical protein